MLGRTRKDSVLVLGGTGFIGREIVLALAEAGHPITVFHRGHTPGDLPSSVDRVLGDRRQLSQHADELRAAQPRVVVDVIAYTESDATACVEVFGGVAERLVVISSQDVYRAYERFLGVGDGTVEAVPYAEEAPLRDQLYPYRDRSTGHDAWIAEYDKILVERVAMADDRLTTTVLRLPMVYGPSDRQQRLAPYVQRMGDRRETIPLEAGHAGWRWTRGYVSNVAHAVALVCGDDRAAGRVYNLGEPEARSEAEWIAAVGRAAGWNGQVIPIERSRWPTERQLPYDWKQDLVADTTGLRDELGYAEAIDHDEALRRTVEWQQRQDQRGDLSQEYAAEDRCLER
jgi:nucleoside-diphosphate-sugar epimerase